MEIREVTTVAELQAVGSFRYAITVKELGLKMIHANHQEQTVIEPMDYSGHVFAVWKSGKVIGTFRTNFLRECSVGDYYEAYDISNLISKTSLEGLAVTTRLALAREYRGSLLTIRVASAPYRYCLTNGITHDVIDSRAPYSGMFERVGYQKHKDDLIHPEFGKVTVMVLPLRDKAHLKTVRSPFYRVLKEHQTFG